jgi:hypothetical protein
MVEKMGAKHSLVEWLLNADLCRKMAERVTDSQRKIVWLNLARQWLTLGDRSELETRAERVAGAVQDKGRQKSPLSHK